MALTQKHKGLYFIVFPVLNFLSVLLFCESMKDLKNKHIVESEMEKAIPPSQLYLEALGTRSKASDTNAALTELTAKLQMLAQKVGMSVKEFLARAESDPQFNEDYLDALMTARQIARLKLQR